MVWQQIQCSGCGKLFWTSMRKYKDEQGKKMLLPNKIMCGECRSRDQYIQSGKVIGHQFIETPSGPQPIYIMKKSRKERRKIEKAKAGTKKKQTKQLTSGAMKPVGRFQRSPTE